MHPPIHTAHFLIRCGGLKITFFQYKLFVSDMRFFAAELAREIRRPKPKSRLIRAGQHSLSELGLHG
jgi:hypothetical protein